MGHMRTVAGATLVAALAVASLLTTTTGSQAKERKDDGSLTVAVYGDSPYGTTPTDTRQTVATPAFISTVNADPVVSSVIHVGDVHSGSQFCTEAYDRQIASLWTQFDDSLVYTPGDNEWSDCHKKKEGGGLQDAQGNPVDYADGNPVANLDLVRSLFFARPGRTLGQGHLVVQSQAQHADPAHPDDAAYAENVMWSRKGVLFVTMNIPGGSNNDQDPWYGKPVTDQQTKEVAARTAADLRWLDAAFQRAGADDARAVVIVSQADMWDLDGTLPSDHHLAGYEPFVASVASHTTAFGKPVLMFNGDSHVYRSENPLVQGAPCVTEGAGGEVACPGDDWASHPSYDVPNFHRVVVHGSSFPLEWLKLTVHTKDQAPSSTAFGPFSWIRQAQPQLTPAP